MNKESIKSYMGTELYKVQMKSVSENILIADEPVDAGGQNLGFNPMELLLSALAACTSATIRMYVDRKGWDLKEVNLDLEIIPDTVNGQTEINRKIELIGDLDEEQRKRILLIATKCPVHKILTGNIHVESELKSNLEV